MFKGTIKETRNYDKHCNAKSGKVTGRALLVSTSPYAIIDIDINHDLSDERKGEIRGLFQSVIDQSAVKVVQTGSGGYHFYTQWDQSFEPTKDSYTKVYKHGSEFDVDLFVPFAQQNKNSRCILLPGTKAKNKEGKVGQYELIKDCDDDELISFTDFKEVLQKEVGIELNIEHKAKEENHVKHSSDEVDDPDENYPDFEQIQNHTMTKEMFDILVKGFDECIVIHNDGGQKLGEEVAILHVVTALNACINSEISRDDVEDALDYIYDHASLTDNAETNWDRQIRRNKGKKAEHCGGLFTILKLYNPQYYREFVMPMLKSKTSTPNDFLTERYTISDFKSEKVKFKTLDDYINNLVKCIAFLDSGDYILKEKEDNRVTYTVIDDTKLKKVLNFKAKYSIKYEITEEQINKAKKNHKKLPGEVGEEFEEVREANMMKLLQDNDVQAKFKRFVRADLIGDDREVFGLYRPPNPSDYYVEIKNKPELVEQFLQLVRDQMYDENALQSFEHFLKVNAYLLQYHKKASTFFVKYSTTGNTGKNYIDNAFSRLYEGFTLNGITDQQIKEKHNGGMVGKLYRSYDEFENSNYMDRSINDVVKRLTNPKMAGRSMNTDTREVKNYAIDVLNTNDPGIYGMISFQNKALLSRLCIMRLKERDIRKSEYISNINVIDDKNFAYSLYTYLMNIDLKQFISTKSYDRYPEERTDVIIKQLYKLKPSALDEFLDAIYDKFSQKELNGILIDWILCTELKCHYDNFMYNRKFKLTTSLDSELEARGLKKEKKRIFRGENPKHIYYRNHIERLDNNDDCDDEPLCESEADPLEEE